HNLGETEGTTITPAEVEALRRQDPAPLLLDVRSALEFESERIEGARHIPLDALEARLEEIPGQAEVVVVCRTGVRATIAADLLARAGRRPRVMEGGMLGWRHARLPVREGRKRLAVDRPVQPTAGSVVLVGPGGGALVSPWFLVVPAFMGGGLTFAGATGTCGMALVLLKMPWNRPAAAPAEGPAAVCAAGGGAAAPPTCAAP